MSKFQQSLRRNLPTAFIRNTSARIYLDVFFVFAASTILVTRFFLHLTGYPQISGGSFHIAHVLPGGMLMLLALILLLTYLDHQARWLAAVLGGIGFGLFIDEFGKFITANNDYFFQPTIALIYAVFVLLFFAFRRLSSQRSLTRETYIVNALELSKDVFIKDFDASEKARALEYLRHGDPGDPVIHALAKALQDVPVQPPARQSVITRIAAGISTGYDWAVRRGWFVKVAVVYFASNAGFGIAQAVSNLLLHDSFAAWGALVSSGVAAALVVAGIIRIWRNRLAAYAYFRMGFMILILFTQFFIFIDDEFSALAGLLIYLVGLLAVDSMIRQERSTDLPAS